MKTVECISCKQEIPLTGPFVEFECPLCGAKIARCEKCRTFGHGYKCECGFEGPQILNGGIRMGEVLTTMKIMPDSPDIDLEAIKSTIESSMPEGARIHEISEEPIAFGLVAVILQFITEDGEGGSEAVEEMVQAIDGVASFEVTGVGRLM